MPSYTPWTWSPPHGRHYMYHLADDGRILETLWAGPQAAATTAPHNNTASTQPPARDRTQNNSAMVPGGSGGGEDESDDDEEEEEEEEEGEEESDEEPTSPARTTASAVSNNHPSVGARTGQNRRQDSGIDTTQLGRLSISPSHAPGWTPRIQAVSTHAAPLSYRSTYNPATASPSYHPRSPPLDPYRSLQFYHDPGIGSSTQAGASHNNRSNVSNLPVDIQAQLKALERRYIRTDPSTNNEEHLDPRYRRVVLSSHTVFFVPGRVFKMLWTEPAGQGNPGRTRNSTHFSTIWLGEQAYSEIRHFIVVRNKGTFSQCIPVQTYRGLGAAKPGLVMEDHGIIHTTPTPPDQLPNEALTKYSIRVQPTKTEVLHPASRVNYGKAYAVEHNVKVLDIGMVVQNHRYLLSAYFDEAMRAL